jgi:hypothetical protein
MTMSDNAPSGMMALLGRLNGDTDAAPPTFPLRAAQVMEINRIIQASAVADQARLGWRRGDPVRWIDGTGPFRNDARGKIAFVFWCWIDLSEPWAQQILRRGASDSDFLTQAHVDCLVGWRGSPSEGLRFSIADSGLLEPDTAADLTL